MNHVFGPGFDSVKQVILIRSKNNLTPRPTHERIDGCYIVVNYNNIGFRVSHVYPITSAG